MLIFRTETEAARRTGRWRSLQVGLVSGTAAAPSASSTSSPGTGPWCRTETETSRSHERRLRGWSCWEEYSGGGEEGQGYERGREIQKPVTSQEQKIAF